MSRIGKQPIAVPKGVTVTAERRRVTVKGPKGELAHDLSPGFALEQAPDQVRVVMAREDRQARALYGMHRAVLANHVAGVSRGFTRVLEIQGTGYRAAMEGTQKLVLQLGFSHPVRFAVPAGVQIKVENPTRIVISGADRQLVGQVAADVRNFRPPEPYKGKGIRYEGEFVRRKAGKSAGAGA
jgi:large subunit ribosomal protein L6